jgi:hypothetical protein
LRDQGLSLLSRVHIELELDTVDEIDECGTVVIHLLNKDAQDLALEVLDLLFNFDELLADHLILLR